MITKRRILKHFGFVVLTLSSFCTNAFSIRTETIDREPQRFTTPADPLVPQVDKLQTRADHVAQVCNLRQYDWCRDLSTLDVSIKGLRGDVTDPILERRHYNLLQSRIDLANRQMKGLEDRIKYAE